MNPIYIVSCKATRTYLKLVDGYLQSLFLEYGFKVYLSTNAIDNEKKWFKGILKSLDNAKTSPVVIIDTNMVDEEFAMHDEYTDLISVAFGKSLLGETTRDTLFGPFQQIKEEIKTRLDNDPALAIKRKKPYAISYGDRVDFYNSNGFNDFSIMRPMDEEEIQKFLVSEP